MKEMWEDVKGFEGLYQVSNFGRVKSLGRIVDCPTNRYSHQKIKERILKPSVQNNRYHYNTVVLCKGGIQRTVYVHLLVWDAFASRPRQNLLVDHIDGDGGNNVIKNLQLLTNRQNIAKGFRSKRKYNLPTGVYKSGEKYQAQIYMRGRKHSLGTFDTPGSASRAYYKALNSLGGQL